MGATDKRTDRTRRWDPAAAPGCRGDGGRGVTGALE